VRQLIRDDSSLKSEVEANKKKFVGFEIHGKTLGVIGLGNIGVKVSNAALHLGMHVIGYDPTISIKNAWELSAAVTQANHIEELVTKADFISLHVPLLESTKNILNQAEINAMKPEVVLLNFSREGLINHHALCNALQAKKLHAYVTDFPSSDLLDYPNVITLPHLGASTKEAEENCAQMAVKGIKQFLEHGSISHSVNFPMVQVQQFNSGIRLAIANANIPNMVAQISSKLASAGLNINRLVNQSRDAIAYTVVDINENIQDDIINEISAIEGVIKIRKV
jgi:D-3-phosphoglycerate dehydrogenase